MSVDEYLSLPQFSRFQNPSIQESTPINIALTKAKTPNILAYSQNEFGNIYLHEVNHLVILLCVPPGLELPFSKEVNIRMSEKTYPTEQGEKTGYVFYKNNQSHMNKLDEIFRPTWRDRLSEPLPTPKESKTPVLMMRKDILFNGEIVPASLWEYSDVSLVVFTPRDFSNGNPKLMKPFHKFVCPDSPSGYSPGYGVYKNNSAMIDFAKKLFEFPDLETKYVKSQPKTYTPVAVQKEPHFIFRDISFNSGFSTHTMDIIEISPLAITIFPSPILMINDFQSYYKDSLYHPTKGKQPGYLIPKSRNDLITILENFFQLDKLEGFYTMTQEEAQVIAPPPGSMPLGPNQAKDMSNAGINSFSDIPISTLLRLLEDKLKNSGPISNKEEFKRLLIFGDADKVISEVASFDEMTTSIEVKCGDKMAVFLDP